MTLVWCGCRKTLSSAWRWDQPVFPFAIQQQLWEPKYMFWASHLLQFEHSKLFQNEPSFSVLYCSSSIFYFNITNVLNQVMELNKDSLNPRSANCYSATEAVSSYTLSKMSLSVHHTLGRQPYLKKGLCVQWDLWYSHFGFHFVLEIESCNFLNYCLTTADFLMIMYPKRHFRHCLVTVVRTSSVTPHNAHFVNAVGEKL
jgi:hypothetical protein